MNQGIDPRADDLGEALRHLYGAARRMSLGSFQARAIELLRIRVAFDCCWWGAGTRIDGCHHIHHSYLWNMPGDAPDILNLTEHDNVVAQTASRHPGKALVFATAELESTPATKALARHAGLCELLVIGLLDPVAELVSFLSVGKQDPTSHFHSTDQRWFELLMPHLGAMLDMSRLNDVLLRRTSSEAPNGLLAATDVKGILHVAEPGFTELLRGEWPDWVGPWLPKPLRAHLGSGSEPFRGRCVNAEFSRLDAQLLVKLSPRTLLEELTAQEIAVARMFGNGHSHKDVARALAIAPATARHHLRSIYTKLQVNDKAALAQMLNRPPALHPGAPPVFTGRSAKRID